MQYQGDFCLMCAVRHVVATSKRVVVYQQGKDLTRTPPWDFVPLCVVFLLRLLLEMHGRHRCLSTTARDATPRYEEMGVMCPC